MTRPDALRPHTSFAQVPLHAIADLLTAPDRTSLRLPGSGPRPSLLFVDPAGDAVVAALQRSFEVTAVASQERAVRALRTFHPTLVVTELTLPDGDGVEVCRESKTLPADPPLVLVTTATAARVPDALVAGCDSVLVKPFPPNLLYTRVGLLLRQPGAATVAWRDVRCPSCLQGGAVSFDTARGRRLWYACLKCHEVWIGARGTGPQRRWARRQR